MAGCDNPPKGPPLVPPKGPPLANPLKETFPDLNEAMQSKHPRRGRKKTPTLGDVPTHELFDVDDDDEFTPIHNFGDLGRSLSTIRQSTDSMSIILGHVEKTIEEHGRKIDKLGTDQTRDISNLQARQKSSESRLKELERETKVLASPRPHDCYRGDDIEDIKDEGRQTRLEVQGIVSRVAVTETKIKTNEEAIREDGKKTDARWGRVIGVGVTLILFLLASVGGWIAIMYTLKANMETFGSEQTKLRSTVENMRTTTTKSASAVKAEAKKLRETATAVSSKSISDAAPPPDPLDALWCDLSHQEKRHQARIRGRDKIPMKECPR